MFCTKTQRDQCCVLIVFFSFHFLFLFFHSSSTFEANSESILFYLTKNNMLVRSSQSSSQRPLGLSCDELFAIDRQYYRIESKRPISANLHRPSSRSLDLISSSNAFVDHSSRPIHTCDSVDWRRSPTLNCNRSNSIDQFRYTSTLSPVLQSTYQQRTTPIHDIEYDNYPGTYEQSYRHVS
jgi:hypothetical protein